MSVTAGLAKRKKSSRKRHRLSLEDREQMQKLCLMDNDFMNIALDDNNACVEEMLRVILGKEDLKVTRVRTQSTIQGFSRSICLDIDADDSEGRRYDIEMQQASEGAEPRRARFHGAMMDSRALKAGQNFKDLPERYVIFVTRDDVLGLEQTLYMIHEYIDGSLQPFDDGAHIIYINGAAKDDGSALWKLIHDLQCAKASEMYFPCLAARVRFLKEDEEGKAKMASYFEAKMANYFEEQREKIAKKAEKQAQESFAVRLIRRGKDTLDEIADCTGLTLRRVKSLAKTAGMATA